LAIFGRGAAGAQVNPGHTGKRVGKLVTAGVPAMCLAMVWLVGMSIPAFAKTKDDALVFCLSPARRTGLLDAAVALGFASRDQQGTYRLPDGRELDPMIWHRDDPGGFDRACNALFAAQRPPGPSDFATVLPFLTGLTGAIVAFIASISVAKIARSRGLADDLRSAFEGFRLASEARLHSWSQGTSTVQAVLGRKGTLLTQLARVRAARRRWTVPSAVQAELTGGKLDGVGAAGQSKQDVIDRLDKAQDTVFRIAHALEQPIRPHPAMRATPVGDQT